MIHGTKSKSGEVLTNGFMSERQLSPRYIWDVERHSRLLLSDLSDESLYLIYPEQIKAVYITESRPGHHTVTYSIADAAISVELGTGHI